MSETLHPVNPVLIVDDEEQFLLSAEFALNGSGLTNTITCSDSRKVMSILSEIPVSIITLDMTMPHISGSELLPQIVAEYPEIPVIIITAINEVDNAVESIKNGALDYLVKPVDDTRLITTIKRTIELSAVREENRRLKQYFLSDKLEYPEAFSEIITHNPKMRSIFQYIEAIASSPLPILVTGETGVGKELVARSIHQVSQRKGQFVPVNIAGVDDHLFSDTLFGHKRGAFTGADRDRKGLIEQAAGGTLFLDEIGDLEFESQVKLLRLIQDGTYFPIGSDVPKLSDTRILVATNANLNEMQRQAKFRKDLFYRIQAHHIHLPPLRDRKEDIPMLLTHFLEKAAKTLNKKTPAAPKELIPLLRNYTFPGNIREMEGLIFDAVTRHKSGILSMESFKEKVVFQHLDTTPDGNSLSYSEKALEETIIIPEGIFPKLKEMEQILVEEALRRAEGNQTIAAELLGLTRRALNNRLSRTKKKAN